MFTLWLRAHYAKRGGKPGRDYRIHAPDGTLRWIAHARRAPGPFDVFLPDAPDTPVLRGRPRRSFPLTGRYDVLGPAGERLGVVTRSGRFFDADRTRLGRFRDARSMREHVGEGVLTMVVEGIIAGESAAGIGPGASAYVVTLENGLPPGRLARERLPFTPDDEPVREPGRLARGIRRVLPRRAADKLLERGSHGWILELPDTGDLSHPLLLAGAILAIEIALW